MMHSEKNWPFLTSMWPVLTSIYTLRLMSSPPCQRLSLHCGLLMLVLQWFSKWIPGTLWVPLGGSKLTLTRSVTLTVYKWNQMDPNGSMGFRHKGLMDWPGIGYLGQSIRVTRTTASREDQSLLS